MTEEEVARVYFMRDFDYKPTPRRLIAYKAGDEKTVKRACADMAIAKGAAIEVKPPSRDGRVRALTAGAAKIGKFGAALEALGAEGLAAAAEQPPPRHRRKSDAD